MIKEPTSSTFVFHRGEDGWRLGLVWHPRLECWLPPGGHVEAEESPAEAAVREVAEETGLAARLVPGPALPLPPGFPHRVQVAPWWTVEMRAGRDNHTPERHVHVDHTFLAVVTETEPDTEPGHRVRWFTESELAEDPQIAEDSRLQAKELFARIDSAAAAPA